jgi:hypothetical protein
MLWNPACRAFVVLAPLPKPNTMIVGLVFGCGDKNAMHIEKEPEEKQMAMTMDINGS